MSVASSYISTGNINNYDHLVGYLLMAFQRRLLKYYRQEPANQNKFLHILCKVKQKLHKLPDDPPIQNISLAIDELIDAINPPNRNLNNPSNRGSISRCYQSPSMSRRVITIEPKNMTKYNSLPRRMISEGSFRKKQFYNKQHKSFQNVNKHFIRLQEDQSKRDNQNLYPHLKSKVDYYKSIRQQLHPPKLSDYIHTNTKSEIKRKSSYLSRVKQRNLSIVKEMKNQGSNYIGQRRKKQKAGRRLIGYAI